MVWQRSSQISMRLKKTLALVVYTRAISVISWTREDRAEDRWTLSNDRRKSQNMWWCTEIQARLFCGRGYSYLGQEHLRRLGNAGKQLFRVYWRDWHESITLKLSIYHFEPPKFGHPPNNSLKMPKMSNRLLFQSWRWSHKNWTISTTRSADIWPLKSHFYPQYRVFVITFGSKKILTM